MINIGPRSITTRLLKVTQQFTTHLQHHNRRRRRRRRRRGRRRLRTTNKTAPSAIRMTRLLTGCLSSSQQIATNTTNQQLGSTELHDENAQLVDVGVGQRHVAISEARRRLLGAEPVRLYIHCIYHENSRNNMIVRVVPQYFLSILSN